MADDDTIPGLDDDQILWGAAEMFVRRHGARASDLVARRAAQLAEDGDAAASALYAAIAARIGEMGRTGASH